MLIAKQPMQFIFDHIEEDYQKYDPWLFEDWVYPIGSNKYVGGNGSLETRPGQDVPQWKRQLLDNKRCGILRIWQVIEF